MNSGIYEIILAVIALIGNAGWIVSRSQLRKNKAQAEKEELDLSQEYVNSFRENIYIPLEKELQKLRASIERVNVCPHRANCPVARELYRTEGEPAESNT